MRLQPIDQPKGLMMRIAFWSIWRRVLSRVLFESMASEAIQMQ